MDPFPNASTHFAVNGTVLIMRRRSARLPLAWLAFRLCNSAGPNAPDAARELRVARNPFHYPQKTWDSISVHRRRHFGFWKRLHHDASHAACCFASLWCKISALHPAQNGGAWPLPSPKPWRHVPNLPLPLCCFGEDCDSPPKSCPPQTACCSTTAGTQRCRPSDRPFSVTEDDSPPPSPCLARPRAGARRPRCRQPVSR